MDCGRPILMEVCIVGEADILFHRWQTEPVEDTKKDDLESYIYRNEDGYICIPGAYFKGALVSAARFHGDPRVARKSAQDLIKSAVLMLSDLASLGKKSWDYEHKCRALIQKRAINRVRPAIYKGWRCSFELVNQLPNVLTGELFEAIVQDAGRIVGLADYRPTYGRFRVEYIKTIN